MATINQHYQTNCQSLLTELINNPNFNPNDSQTLTIDHDHFHDAIDRMCLDYVDTLVKPLNQTKTNQGDWTND